MVIADFGLWIADLLEVKIIIKGIASEEILDVLFLKP